VGKVYAIGDIHGCADELRLLLDHLQPGTGDTVICLGDYIDRGPDSKGVVDRLLALRREGPECVFLKGNHEDMLLAHLGFDGHYGEAFLYNGGAATLRSYDCEGAAPDDIARRLPPEHLEFFRALRHHHRAGEVLCVHAGLRPGRPLEAQSTEDLLWIREEFVQHTHDLGVLVLFGHTPYREVFVHLPYKVGLDTGLVYGNKLSCLEIASRTLHQIARHGDTVVSRPLADLIAPEV